MQVYTMIRSSVFSSTVLRVSAASKEEALTIAETYNPKGDWVIAR